MTASMLAIKAIASLYKANLGARILWALFRVYLMQCTPTHDWEIIIAAMPLDNPFSAHSTYSM